MVRNHIGWLPISVPSTLEGVNNPRPIIVKAVDEGKIAILHLIDAYGKSICKKANFMARAVDHNGQNTAIQNLDDMTETQKQSYMPCPECYNEYGKRKEDGS